MTGIAPTPPCGQQSVGAHQPRVALFDSLRGFTILSMIGFHAAYDAVYLFGFPLTWFSDPIIQNVWRASISWVFLFLAGWMTSLSRNNVRRGAIYAAAALVVTIATGVAGVDDTVTFGILFCMAASTLITAAIMPLLQRIPPAAGCAAAFIAFACTYGVPLARYPLKGLAWLGLPSPVFSSGDYYPLLPFFFMYLAGACGARWFGARHPEGYPRWMLQAEIPVISSVGRLSLPIYLLHQPLLLGLFMFITR